MRAYKSLTDSLPICFQNDIPALLTVTFCPIRLPGDQGNGGAATFCLATRLDNVNHMGETNRLSRPHDFNVDIGKIAVRRQVLKASCLPLNLAFPRPSPRRTFEVRFYPNLS